MQLSKSRRYQGPAVVLERLWPEVRTLLQRYRVPPSEGEGLIQDTLLALLYKWDGMVDHDYWLLKTLERRCRRLYGPPEGDLTR